MSGRTVHYVPNKALRDLTACGQDRARRPGIVVHDVDFALDGPQRRLDGQVHVTCGACRRVLRWGKRS